MGLVVRNKIIMKGGIWLCYLG